MAESFIVRPIGRSQAAALCARHPHARTLPGAAKYNFRLDINGRPAGLAAWGYGITPRGTPAHLFGKQGRVGDYLELSRFFCFDGVPANTPSRFLAVTHRLLKRHTPLKWLYTYAAGFQGLVGYIYKASGYEYIGRQKTDALLWVPGVGLIHRIPLWHRYGKGTTDARQWQDVFPGSKQWCGYNFRYIYWLCKSAEKEKLMQTATFQAERPPTENDIEIWTVDGKGWRQGVSPERAKSVAIVKLPTRRRAKHSSDAAGDQSAEGGVEPTRTLQRP